MRCHRCRLKGVTRASISPVRHGRLSGWEGVRARRRADPRPEQRSHRGDRRDRRKPACAQGIAAQHRRGRHRHLPNRGRSDGGPAADPGPGATHRAGSGHGALLRRRTSVRAVDHPEAHRRRALRRADQAHPVVGTADADLGCARARRDLLAEQGDADHDVAAELLPAPVGAVGILTVVDRRGHRVRQQPGDDVSAAAHRRAAVSVPDLVGVRGVRLRPEEDRHHRPRR